MSRAPLSPSDICLERFSAFDSSSLRGVDMSHTPDLWNTKDDNTENEWLELIENSNKLDGWYTIFDEGDESINEGETNDKNTRSSQLEQQPILFYPHEMQEYTISFPISVPSISEYDDGDRDMRHGCDTNEESNASDRKNAAITLHLWQAWSAFGDSGDDDTGLVLWGASVTLGQFLISEHERYLMEDESKMSNDSILSFGEQQRQSQKQIEQGHSLERIQRQWVQVQGRTVLELGCGSAIPSLITYHLGSKRVFATDFRQATLAHVSYHAEQNNCRSPIFQVASLDWENHLRNRNQIAGNIEQPNQTDGGSACRQDNDSLQVDVILAADVIYGTSLVPALVATIDAHLRYNDDEKIPSSLKAVPAPPPQVVIATRDGRCGIKEFRQLMTSAPYNFAEVYAQSYNNQDYVPFIPSNFQQDDLSLGRWNGNHSIYVYQRAG